MCTVQTATGSLIAAQEKFWCFVLMQQLAKQCMHFKCLFAALGQYLSDHDVLYCYSGKMQCIYNWAFPHAVKKKEISTYA